MDFFVPFDRALKSESILSLVQALERTVIQHKNEDTRTGRVYGRLFV